MPPTRFSCARPPGLRNTGGEHDALYFFHKPSTLGEFMLFGGIVKGVLDRLTPIAGGGA
jgi:hypothetical protein